MNGGYVVEQPVDSIVENGKVVRGTGTARVYVATEARAKEVVQQGLDVTPPIHRTYRPVTLEEMPEKARQCRIDSAKT